MKELFSLWGDAIKAFPKKAVYLFLILYFAMRYLAGGTFLWEFWHGRASIAELLQFMQLLK